MIQKVFVAILALICLFAFAGIINSGIHNLRTEEVRWSDNVTTGAGISSANITLDSELFGSNTMQVISIDSSIEESPQAISYNPTSQVLLVGPLTPATSRILTIDYYTGTSDEVFSILGPFMGLLIFGGLIGVIIYGVYKRR